MQGKCDLSQRGTRRGRSRVLAVGAAASAAGLALVLGACTGPGTTGPSGTAQPLGPLFGPTAATSQVPTPSPPPSSTAPAPSSSAGLKLDVDAAVREFTAKSSGFRASLSATMKERLASARASLSASHYEPSACAPYVVSTSARLPVDAKVSMASSSQGTATFFWVPTENYAQREQRAKEIVAEHCAKATVSDSRGSATVETVYFSPSGVSAPATIGMMRRITDTSGSSTKADQGTTVVVFNGTVGVSASVLGTNGDARKQATELAKRAYSTFMGSSA